MLRRTGGTKCVTPTECLPKFDEIDRMKSPSPILEVRTFGVINLESYENILQNELKRVSIEDVNTSSPPPKSRYYPNLENYWYEMTL
ncbi:hypothetical protein FQR65_LT10068 [Abscondita terminalis]|nr:hypothetical protein FQR65_LT10068 [Abscondita terminalis]